MSIVEKIKARLQKRRSKSRSSIFARSTSLSTASCRSSASNSSSSSSWECSDWNESSSSDDECEGCSSGDAAPVDVPEGFLAVYVGDERQRYVINARHLSHPWFKALLEKSAEEFGFDHKEGLRLPCAVPAFERMVEKLNRNGS